MDLTNPVSCLFTNTEPSDSGQIHVDLPISTQPWDLRGVMKDLRHLRIHLFLPDPYRRALWTDTLVKHLTGLIESTANGTKLKDLRILISTWHRFRELTGWQTEVLGLLGQFRVQGHTQVRTRSLDGKLRAALGELDLANKLRDVAMASTPDIFTELCETAGDDMDWEWEGGVVV